MKFSERDTRLMNELTSGRVVQTLRIDNRLLTFSSKEVAQRCLEWMARQVTHQGARR